MTNEEAIHIIDVAFGVPQAVRRFGEDRTYHEAEIREAKDMAIKALSCSENPSYNSIKTELDAISREAAIDAISRIGLCKCSTNEVQAVDECLRAVEYLPSVSQKQEIPIDCSDSICRADAIKLVKSYIHEIITESGVDKNSHTNKILTDIVKFLAFELPSVSTEKTGRWIDDEFGSKCSCCGIHTHLDKFDRPMKFKHCSMCGAKMGVEE